MNIEERIMEIESRLNALESKPESFEARAGAYDAMCRETRWCGTDECLPDDWMLVIGAWECGGNMRYAVFRFWRNKVGPPTWSDQSGTIREITPTHWRPLTFWI